MNFINPPTKTPHGVTHETFASGLVRQDIGYNIYLPPGYEDGNRRYPVTYHIHGYQGSESSDIWALERVYTGRQEITVFANATTEGIDYDDYEQLIESIIITELIPHIDAHYRTIAEREGRELSGWSMGGAGAFRLAAKNLNLFSSVTAYAGTYHHWYHKDYRTAGEASEKAAGLFEKMRNDKKCFAEDTMLYFIRQNAERIRGLLRIRMQVGTADPLLCDNEILHLFLCSWDIPHEYNRVDGVAHELGKVI